MCFLYYLKSFVHKFLIFLNQIRMKECFFTVFLWYIVKGNKFKFLLCYLFNRQYPVCIYYILCYIRYHSVFLVNL